MPERVGRPIRRMLGEFLREASVLVAVFAPLDWFFNRGPLTVGGIAGIVVVAVACLSVGIVLELER